MLNIGHRCANFAVLPLIETGVHHQHIVTELALPHNIQHSEGFYAMENGHKHGPSNLPPSLLHPLLCHTHVFLHAWYWLHTAHSEFCFEVEFCFCFILLY